MTFRGAPRALALALALLPTALSAPATAEPTREERAAATALFDEGRRLAAEKKHAEACPKFEQAMKLDPGMGTLFNLSDCYEQTGRLASAWSGFRDVAAQAKAANQAEREKVARERAAALEAKLPRVRIVLPAELAGDSFAITRDGAPFPPVVGTAIPVDPGPHTMRVVVEGREPWETTVTLTPGATVEVVVPVLARKAAPAATSAPAATATPSSAASAAPSSTGAAAPSGAMPDVGAPRPWQMPLGIGALAAGVAGLGVGIGFGVAGKLKQDEANRTLCSEKTCINEEGVQMRADAVGLGNVGTVIGVVGSVIGAAGIVLWITAPSAPAKAAIVRDVKVGAAPGGMVIRGQF